MINKRTAQNVFRLVKALGKGHTQGDLYRAAKRALTVPVASEFSSGLFNFTIDFELYWGNGNLGGLGHSEKRRIKSAEKQAENFSPFVEMLERLNFPISWAIPGILLEPKSIPTGNSKFQPSWAENWYGLPSSIQGRPELWKGEAYVNQIQSRPDLFEVLSHGYAHIDYSDPSVSREVAQADVLLSKQALTQCGFEPEGFVYPCNAPGWEDLIVQSGFSILRGAQETWVRSDSRIVTPVGFWMSPAMMTLNEAKLLVRAGIENRSFVHPWIHLVECESNCRDIRNFYEPLFSFVLEQQALKKIQNVSFREILRKLLPSPRQPS